MADVKISGLPVSTTPLAGTEVLPIVQSGVTKQVANNDLRPKQIQSNTTSGVLQVVGPAAAATRVMTTPDANFTVARTDAAQTFSGIQTYTGAAPQIFMQNSGTYALQLLMAGSTATVGTTNNTPLSLITNTTAKLTLNSSDSNITVNSGNLIIGTSGKGIDFSANANPAGMTSELLNDYEEGTFTPTIIGTTTAGTATYSVQTGRYTKVGRLVYFTMQTAYTGHTGTGNMQVSGLPFTSAVDSPVSCNPSSLTFSNDLIASVAASSAAIVFFTYATNASAALLPIDTAANIVIAGCYST